MEARGAADGERKTITALFADIKGSMTLIERLDPEEARSIVDPALKLMMDAVHRYEGYVAQSTGDGIFAFFGAPIAHEDHPQRALYAALLMQEEIRRFAEKLRPGHGSVCGLPPDRPISWPSVTVSPTRGYHFLRCTVAIYTFSLALNGLSASITTVPPKFPAPGPLTPHEPPFRLVLPAHASR